MDKVHIYSGRESGEGLDVSGIAYGMAYTSSIDGQPGKLTFSLKKDPNGILHVENGNAVAFWHDDEPVFFGYVFRLGTGKGGAVSVTAYDQMRYLQNHEFWTIRHGEKTLDDVFGEICSKYQLRHKIEFGHSSAKLNAKNFQDVAAYDIIQYAMHEANVGGVEGTVQFNDSYDAAVDRNFSGYNFFVRDRFGTIELNEVSHVAQIFQAGNSQYVNGVPIIGERSLLTDWSYDLSIDDGTFNELILMENRKGSAGEQGKTDIAAARADGAKSTFGFTLPDTVSKWGVLRKIVTIKDGATKQQVQEYLKLALEDGSQPKRTLRLDALGIPGLYAGDVFCLQIDDLGIKSLFYINSVTHSYGRIHKMQLSVSTNSGMKERL